MDKTDLMVSELHTVKLPSGGLLYGGKMPAGEIKIRPMTTREEKLLLSARQSRDTLLYDVARACVVEPNEGELALDDYLIGDVVFIFLSIRAATYGPDYSFEPSCRFCSAPVTVEVSLPHDLGVYVLGEGFKEPFFVELPKGGSKLGLRLFRVKDEKAITSFGKRHATRQTDDPAYSYRLAKHIASIDGEEAVDIKEMTAFVDSMHAADTEAMRDKIIEEDCGVDLQLDRECPSCSRMNEVFFEFTPDFFRSRPSRLRGRRRTLR